jgi:hypothetical protein
MTNGRAHTGRLCDAAPIIEKERESELQTYGGISANTRSRN